ncbi:unnamed protein product [Rangifer tarandus platyrhynchus]|uniref:Uncharacterized protein n=2 Tax=Rangifer tarandus platyrhynchus TaxID=3082113 RepID=A0ABN8YRE0_RANTA|nr:unnamed protein product [Rangifer tarandus platyrhynchus]
MKQILSAAAGCLRSLSAWWNVPAAFAGGLVHSDKIAACGVAVLAFPGFVRLTESPPMWGEEDLKNVKGGDRPSVYLIARLMLRNDMCMTPLSTAFYFNQYCS